MNDFLKIKDVGYMFGVTHQTIRNWIKAGRLPVVKLGPKTFRVRQSDVDRLVQQVTHEQ